MFSFLDAKRAALHDLQLKTALDDRTLKLVQWFVTCLKQAGLSVITRGENNHSLRAGRSCCVATVKTTEPLTAVNVSIHTNT